MAQTFTDDSFAAGHAGLTDLQNMENNFAALKSSFSGADAPSDAVAGMLWFHTTNKILKVRNNAGDAWLGVLYGAATLKTWLYLNAAPDGWVVDAATATDRVLSIKGGSQAYNANGGTNAGTWTVEAAHTHTIPITGYGSKVDAGNTTVGLLMATSADGSGTISTTSPNSGSGGGSAGTWRPAAAIGTLQYPAV